MILQMSLIEHWNVWAGPVMQLIRCRQCTLLYCYSWYNIVGCQETFVIEKRLIPESSNSGSLHAHIITTKDKGATLFVNSRNCAEDTISCFFTWQMLCCNIFSYYAISRTRVEIIMIHIALKTEYSQHRPLACLCFHSAISQQTQQIVLCKDNLLPCNIFPWTSDVQTFFSFTTGWYTITGST